MMNKEMFKIGVLGVFLISIVSVGCCQNKTAIKITAAEALLNRLENIQGKGILFGHQDDLAYGMGWQYTEGESDMKRVSGSYPSVFGWDIGGLEIGNTKNLDGVPFNYMKRNIIKTLRLKLGISMNI